MKPLVLLFLVFGLSGTCGNYLFSSIAIRPHGQRTPIGVSISRYSASTPVEKSEIEYSLRGAIMRNDIEGAKSLLQSLDSTLLPNGKNIIYIITETSRRTGNSGYIIDLMSAIKTPIQCFEDDVMPILSEFIDKGNMNQAQSIFTFLNSRNIAFSAKLYSLMLKGYGMQRNEGMITYLLNLAVEHKIKVDTILLNSAMDAFIRCNKNEIAIALFENTILKQSDNHLYLKYSGMSSVLNYFFSCEIKPNVRTFNILIKGIRSVHMMKDGNTITALIQCADVIKQMKLIGVKPDSITVNTLVDVSVISGNFRTAEKILYSSGVEAGVEAYTSVIAGYASQGKLDNAFRVFDSMEKAEVVPNSYTLSALMSGCILSNDIDRARELFKMSFKTGNKADIASLCGAYIIGLCKRNEANDISEVMRAFAVMKERGVSPDTATVNAYIQSLCALHESEGDMSVVLTAFYDAITRGLEPDDYTYSILFSALGKRGYVNEVIKLFQNTRKSFDTPAINALLRAFVSGNDPLLAIRMYYQLSNRNFTRGEVEAFVPNGITFTTLYLGLMKSAKLLRKAKEQKRNLDENDKAKLSYDEKEGRFYELPDETPLLTNSTILRSNVYIFNLSLPSSKYDIMKSLFSEMRYKYDILPDEVMLTSINSLFTSITKPPPPTYSSLKTVKFEGNEVNTKVAKLVFEDLVICGVDPVKIVPVLLACGYASSQARALLQTNSEIVRRMRSSAASHRIFKKHGWNKMESGWIPL